jgi:NADH-quinone oxidoreductase subunit J
MLTRHELRDKGPQLNQNWGLATVLALLTFGGLFYILSSWSGFSKSAVEISAGTDTLRMLGYALVSPDAYLLPFEVASILLLAALVGAVYIATASKK